MRENYFIVGSTAGFKSDHLEAPRLSGLPHGYFERNADSWVVAVCAAALFLIACGVIA